MQSSMFLDCFVQKLSKKNLGKGRFRNTEDDCLISTALTPGTDPHGCCTYMLYRVISEDYQKYQFFTNVMLKLNIEIKNCYCFKSKFCQVTVQKQI